MFQISSTAFKHGQTIPREYTCEGENVSPPLEWHEAPPGTAAFALICDDPDAPSGTYVHWVIWNISGRSMGLPRAVPTDPQLRDGTVQGRNSRGDSGYRGPCPPPGKPHRYFFKLYALNVPLPLEPGATKERLLSAMQGHILAQTEFYGTYERF
jgi:hypothetical protein